MDNSGRTALAAAAAAQPHLAVLGDGGGRIERVVAQAGNLLDRHILSGLLLQQPPDLPLQQQHSPITFLELPRYYVRGS